MFHPIPIFSLIDVYLLIFFSLKLNNYLLSCSQTKVILNKNEISSFIFFCEKVKDLIIPPTSATMPEEQKQVENF